MIYQIVIYYNTNLLYFNCQILLFLLLISHQLESQYNIIILTSPIK